MKAILINIGVALFVGVTLAFVNGWFQAPRSYEPEVTINWVKSKGAVPFNFYDRAELVRIAPGLRSTFGTDVLPAIIGKLESSELTIFQIEITNRDAQRTKAFDIQADSAIAAIIARNDGPGGRRTTFEVKQPGKFSVDPIIPDGTTSILIISTGMFADENAVRILYGDRKINPAFVPAQPRGSISWTGFALFMVAVMLGLVVLSIGLVIYLRSNNKRWLANTTETEVRKLASFLGYVQVERPTWLIGTPLAPISHGTPAVKSPPPPPETLY